MNGVGSQFLDCGFRERERNAQIQQNLQEARQALENDEHRRLSLILARIHPDIDSALSKVISCDQTLFLNAYRFSTTLADPTLKDKCLLICGRVLTQPNPHDAKCWDWLEEFSEVENQNIAIQWFAQSLRGKIEVGEWGSIHSPFKAKVLKILLATTP